jgi:hypothetical protein
VAALPRIHAQRLQTLHGWNNNSKELSWIACFIEQLFGEKQHVFHTPPEESTAATASFAEVSGGAYYDETAKAAEACLKWLQGQLTHVRKGVADMQRAMLVDAETVQAEQEHQSAAVALHAAARGLHECCASLRSVLSDAIRGLREQGEQGKRQLLVLAGKLDALGSLELADNFIEVRKYKNAGKALQ